MINANVTGVPAVERDDRRGLDAESLQRSFLNHLAFTQGRIPEQAAKSDLYLALATTVRDRLIERWIATRRAYNTDPNLKRVYYLSLEFLIGRTLGNSLINLEIYEECYQALLEIGYDLEEIREFEEDAGLGNGGLGRLAACFLDSMAVLELPAYGYGIRYEYGMFHQAIRDGRQVEEADDWLKLGNPWEIPRPDDALRVQYYGRVEKYMDDRGRESFRWVDTHDVLAVPHDMPVPGYRNNTVNTLRLFSAKSTREFDLASFNYGDYMSACEDKSRVENITKVLYPKDDSLQGQELRLKQEYLLVSASLQDILARFMRGHDDWSKLPDCAAVQLNDTHPVLAIPELMRLLMDREGLGWDEAWEITVRVFAYTNHTVLPEALERWSVSLLGDLLPRHLQIIFEINSRLLDQVARRWPGDAERLSRMSLIEEGPDKKVRMANLAIVGAHSTNGVSALHTDILKDSIMRDFHEFYPDRFNNKTNGVTPRRWLKKANAPLAYLITEAIGDDWVTDLDALQRLVPFADDSEFRIRWLETKRLNKERLAKHVLLKQGVKLDPATMFDCQIKRIHDYKRQILNILHVITLYNRIRAGHDVLPRTVLIAGKAAPGYYNAKLTIELACAVARAVDADPRAAGTLKLAFLADYCVSLAESIIPAAELSQQISTAGMEASGTGNMKLALNGAVTIGTLDGANVEMLEQIGHENMFIFGLTAEQVQQRKAQGYCPWDAYAADENLSDVLDQISSGEFSDGDTQRFRPLVDGLLHGGDLYMVLADYPAYLECQDRVTQQYRDETAWTRMSILNTAKMGRFSSDRTIQEYARDIWRAQATPVKIK